MNLQALAAMDDCEHATGKPLEEHIRTRAVWRNGAWRDRDGNPLPDKSDGLQPMQVMSDISAFKSPLDFKTEISSRSQLRDYEKRNNVRQVGTDIDSYINKVKEHHVRTGGSPAKY